MTTITYCGKCEYEFGKDEAVTFNCPRCGSSYEYFDSFERNANREPLQ